HSTTVSFNMPGTYSIQASAIDGYSPVHSATVSVTVLTPGAADAGTSNDGSVGGGATDGGAPSDMPASGSPQAIIVTSISRVRRGTATDATLDGSGSLGNWLTYR